VRVHQALADTTTYWQTNLSTGESNMRSTLKRAAVAVLALGSLAATTLGGTNLSGGGAL